ncbi:TIGR03619 family F420-dependent LLM class oxidoreductase [Nonomuraea sp. 3-1Str]|uniref:LLM class flavin-dependent oxidoreductase n=1 Tax=Nonomuraea sp. 3-1Str TaxID=2929801 RepID=UPI00285E3234|nr:TIGR03619 family F420-dependent LLM class oxidoreductase [Nonomuraea sp. 3-1Str]MDR8407179.1 TIGR03619 family F420-dependent LLM class oxidoreductase [Nonomuraea sp. 3-1Str]
MDEAAPEKDPGAELRIGYLLPTRDWVVMGDRDLPSLIGQARLAEDRGFDSVWAGDSPVTRPRSDPLLVLAAAAALTERVMLGTAVLLPALRHPILLAHQLATLDRMSGGRLVAGMGAGFPHPKTEAQFEAVGVGFRGRVSRMEESIAAMRRLWSEEEVSFQGTHFAFHDVRLAPKPAQRGGPPIWLAGGGSDATLRRVAGLADGWLPYPPDHQTYADEWTSILRTAAAHGSAEATDNPGGTCRAGTAARTDGTSGDCSPRRRTDGGPKSSRTTADGGARSPGPTPALYATICLDDDPERARSRLRTSIERYYNAPLEVVEGIQAMFAGTAADAAGWLRGYAAAGARHVVIRLAVDDHRAALEEFAAQTLPLLRNGAHS